YLSRANGPIGRRRGGPKRSSVGRALHGLLGIDWEFHFPSYQSGGEMSTGCGWIMAGQRNWGICCCARRNIAEGMMKANCGESDLAAIKERRRKFSPAQPRAFGPDLSAQRR